jgi:SAM-dependent methyltransferase
MSDDLSDDDTLAFYDREAVAYAARREPEASPRLTAFLDGLPPGVQVLDLGCGGGQDSAVMQARGFDVTSIDGSPGMAAMAEARLGRPVRVMRFEALADEEAFDAVWANASLLHARKSGLGDILVRVRRALRPGGLFYAGYKAGEADGRDKLGRYYNFPTRAELEAAYAMAGPWANLEFREESGGGYDGEMRTWLHVTVARPA